MIKLRYEPAKNVNFAINKYTDDIIELAAEGAAEFLRGKLDLHATSGKHWTKYGLPNRSSAPGEYPQKQSGELRDGVETKRQNDFRMLMGFFDSPAYARLLALEDESEGGRDFMNLLFEEDAEETLAFMRDKAEGSR